MSEDEFYPAVEKQMSQDGRIKRRERGRKGRWELTTYLHDQRDARTAPKKKAHPN